MNYWLLIIAIIMAFVVVGLAVYLVIIFQSEEDKMQAWLPKVIVVLGLSLACFNVLLLPYDVANKKSTSVANSVGGGIDTVLMWQIVSWSIAGFTFLLVPFAMFYYEAQDPEEGNACTQLRPAFCYTTITLIVFVTLLLVMWLTIGTADVPYQAYVSTYQIVDVAEGQLMYYEDQSTAATLDMKVSIFVYLVGLMSAIGWLLFFVFGGVGLTAFPIDFILAFRDRPKPMTSAEYATKKAEIARETERLMEAGRKLDEKGRGGGGRSHRKKVAAFKRQVTELEAYYEKLEVSYKEQGGSILKAFLALVLGILGIFLSIAWVLHIIIWNIAGAFPFLNNMFIALDNAFSLMGILAYGTFAFYLLWCVVKGCTKVGLNLLIFTVHPMKLGNTLMNAFLFNTLLILISSVSVVQFCAMSFREYAANTSVDLMFSTYVSRLKGINYLVLYLQYPLIGFAGLSLLWLMICPKRKVEDDDD